jgi:hypothetical protein
MPDALTDPETVIRQAQPGTMIFARAIFEPERGEPEHGWETTLLVREEPKRVKQLGRNPAIALRGGVFIERNVALVELLMQTGQKIYETCFNYYAAESSFADLAHQYRILITFYAPDKARQFIISNGVSRFFAQAEQVARGLPRWAMHDFNQAREQMYAKYPDMQRLWRAIGAH